MRALGITILALGWFLLSFYLAEILAFELEFIPLFALGFSAPYLCYGIALTFLKLSSPGRIILALGAVVFLALGLVQLISMTGLSQDEGWFLFGATYLQLPLSGVVAAAIVVVEVAVALRPRLGYKSEMVQDPVSSTAPVKSGVWSQYLSQWPMSPRFRAIIGAYLVAVPVAVYVGIQISESSRQNRFVKESDDQYRAAYVEGLRFSQTARTAIETACACGNLASASSDPALTLVEPAGAKHVYAVRVEGGHDKVASVLIEYPILGSDAPKPVAVRATIFIGKCEGGILRWSLGGTNLNPYFTAHAHKKFNTPRKSVSGCNR